MTLAFWDSSGFIKLLIEEPGRDVAVEVWNSSADVIASRLAIPEVSAALAAAGRAGRLDHAAEREARRRWERYRNGIELVDLTPDIADTASLLARRHILSGADAVHLAAALSLRAGDPVLVTWDRRLAAASLETGLAVVSSLAT